MSLKVSVQIPTYNQEGYISRAIESVLLQNYADIEIVVLDDCSTDNTYERAIKFKGNGVGVFRNECSIGRVANYKRLLYQFVSGDLVVNLDGDDYFNNPNFIAEAVSQFLTHSDLVIYQACIEAKRKGMVFPFAHKLAKGKPCMLISGQEYFKNFFRNEFFGHLSTVFKADLARKIGFYQFDCLATDAESILKLSLFGDVLLDQSIVGVWNIHGSNESRSFLDQYTTTLACFERIYQYSIPFLGHEAAAKWFAVSQKVNNSYYMTELSKQHFTKFLKECLVCGYFNIHGLKLIVKRIMALFSL